MTSAPALAPSPTRSGFACALEDVVEITDDGGIAHSLILPAHRLANEVAWQDCPVLLRFVSVVVLRFLCQPVALSNAIVSNVVVAWALKEAVELGF